MAARNSGTVWVIHPETGRIEGQVKPPRGDIPEGLSVGGGAIWVAMGLEEAVARIDPETGAVERIPIGGFAQDVTAGAGWIWVVLPEDDLLLKIDPVSLEVISRIPVEGYPTFVIVG